MNLPKLNDKLINRVIEHITKFPESYDQNDVASSCEVEKGTPCGAMACFGGWTVLLSDIPKKERQNRVSEVDLGRAEELLGLTEEEADFLFDGATGTAKSDLKTVKQRVKEIRKIRQTLKNLKNVQQVTVEAETDYDGVVELVYED
jgi:hypothetical protein